MSFGEADRRQLSERGIGEAEAERQLALLRQPPQPFRLLRPCTPGDGIRVLGEEAAEGLVTDQGDAAAAGRFGKLVPASGAATRMFRTLLELLQEDPPPSAEQLARRAGAGDGPAGDALRLLAELPRVPFRDALAAACAARGSDLDTLRERGDAVPVLAALLGPEGLGLADLPKGLVPFHRHPGGEVRTPLEEHLVEGAGYLADGRGACRLHFTVPPEHRERFRAEAQAASARIAARREVRCEVGLSVQEPSTDTLALDPDTGEPFRDDDGTLLLRPGGHGALLHNLQALGGDLLYLKNIDNVLPEGPAQAAVAHWQRVLGGLLVRLEARARELRRRLAGEDSRQLLIAAESFVEELGRPLPGHDPSPAARRRRVLDLLDRPLRVCGVVPNAGEPGGGPFWVRRPDGEISVQIVERAEVPGDDEEQAAVFASSTHFNPVQLACALRDADGLPYELDRFVDPRAVFIARKSHQGRPLLALERPGLWNGAMAGWHTVFVEVPGDTFAPVKTVFDLLRPAHQAAGS
ncbi:MAG TPA: DUF4301 family protein [Thermoanaerobaculia bacterium]|nr:DUF4301 family protein [Thermoanaerobaculia bacterium]